MTDTKVSAEQHSGLTYRWRAQKADGALSFLMFHGLTGNEDVMWILESALPEGGFMAAPRAPFALEGEKSFSWVPADQGDGYQRGDFEAGLSKASSWISGVMTEHDLEISNTVFIGFSQGAALAFLLAGNTETCPAALVSLAGFLPAGAPPELGSLPVFWGHGSQDQTVPVARAKGDIQRLRQVGVDVQYCEAEVGHKVGVECMRGLKEWLTQRVGRDLAN